MKRLTHLTPAFTLESDNSNDNSLESRKRVDNVINATLLRKLMLIQKAAPASEIFIEFFARSSVNSGKNGSMTTNLYGQPL